MGCIALFVLAILSIVTLSLYENGYLDIAVAIIGTVAVLIGTVRAFRARAARSHKVDQRKRQQEEERQTRLRWEQEKSEHQQEEEGQPEWLRREQEEQPEYEEWPVPPVTQERREVEGRQEAPSERDVIVQRLEEMNDDEFGQLMAYYFRHQGYTVDSTPSTSDRGADLLILVDEHRISVRLKRQGEPLSLGDVREALGGRAFYGAYEAWLITSGSFTTGTRYEAKVAGVRLVDGDELVEWLNELLGSLENEP